MTAEPSIDLLAFLNGSVAIRIGKAASIPLAPAFFFVLRALLPSMNQYRALDKHLSQYLWTIVAPSNLNSASVVAIFPQVMQNPGDFFVVCNAGLVWYGISIIMLPPSASQHALLQIQSLSDLI
jgi:hypothetical protein